jgi:hypothetical protein
MKTQTNLLFIFFILLCLNVFSQSKKDILKMPEAENTISEETNLITYKIEFNSELADSILYKRAFHWYQNAIKSMRIQSEEIEKDKKIVGRGELNYMHPATKKGQRVAGRLRYSMNAYFENGNTIVEITRFNVKATNYTPIEPWLELQKEDYNYKYYLLDVEDQAKEILRQFKEFVDVEFVK